MTSYSSPNRMVWQFFEALRRSVARARDADQRHVAQEVAVSVFLAVVTVETFLNLFFRIAVEKDGNTYKDQLLRDLTSPYLSLEEKIKRWPKNILGRSIDLEAGPGKAFIELKNLRNKLMHFTSSHDTLELPGFRVEGLPNTALFDNLTVDNADDALRTAEEFLGAVFIAAGVEPERIPRHLHLWTGKVPIQN